MYKDLYFFINTVGRVFCVKVSEASWGHAYCGGGGLITTSLLFARKYFMDAECKEEKEELEENYSMDSVLNIG